MALLCTYFLPSDFTCRGLRDRWHILVEEHGLFGEPCTEGIGTSLQSLLSDSTSLGQFTTSSGKEGFYVNILKQNLRLMT